MLVTHRIDDATDPAHGHAIGGLPVDPGRHRSLVGVHAPIGHHVQAGLAGRVRAVQQASREVATYLSGHVAAMGLFELISRGDQLPVFALTTAEQVSAFDVFDVSRRVRERGWLMSAYTFPANRGDLAVLRIVVRNGFGHDLADLLLADLRRLLPELQAQSGPLRSARGGTGFHH